MPRWLVYSLLLASLLFPSTADAQGETKLEAINVDLRSEYDQPSMLVIYQFIVSQETPLPVEITLRYPKDSNLYAVAVKRDKWYNKDYTLPAEQGIWQAIKIRVDSYEPYRFEYYQPLTTDGNKRQFKLQWFGDYYVKAFTISLLVPSDSTELVTTPELENTATTSDGSFIFGTITKSDLKTMNTFQFKLEYQRGTALVQAAQATARVVPASPVDENTPGRVSITNLPWIIGGFGLTLIVIALLSYLRSTQWNESQPRKPRRTKNQETEEGQDYCHECGTRAHAGDRFCRTCGSRLKA